MKHFADLYDALDATTSTNAKVDALVSFFKRAPPDEAAWALFFLTGRRLKRLLPSALLHQWTLELTQLPEWLILECYSAVGDYAEAIALLTDEVRQAPAEEDTPLALWIERLQSVPGLPPAAQQTAIAAWWRQLPRRELFLLLKLLTGELRVGVSETLVLRALGLVTGLPPAAMAHRLMGTWEPTAEFFARLVSAEGAADDISRPFPFFLASPLDKPVDALGERTDWLAEWKWDGIRGQLIRRQGTTFLWSRGEELITERFPEIQNAASGLPDGTVMDGEVLAFRDNGPLRFSFLQRRIGRQKLNATVLSEAPCVFMAYDLLEHDGADLRARPISERRQRLRVLLEGKSPSLRLSPEVPGDSWDALAAIRGESRARNVEGFLLKRWSSAYQTGRKKGDWWKWKIDPYSIDAVLVYAQPGHGRRATLFTDYTFALWNDGQLLPVAKAYSGLSDEEIGRVDAWVRQHTLERFGPVRHVEPVHVFELHFEAIAPSTRHKSGIAVRFPRIARWRTDKLAKDADTLQSLQALLPPPTSELEPKD